VQGGSWPASSGHKAQSAECLADSLGLWEELGAGVAGRGGSGALGMEGYMSWGPKSAHTPLL
jgi:hypothetical protein